MEKEAAPPKFVNALKDRECKEGEMINFECEVISLENPILAFDYVFSFLRLLLIDILGVRYKKSLLEYAQVTAVALIFGQRGKTAFKADIGTAAQCVINWLQSS